MKIVFDSDLGRLLDLIIFIGAAGKKESYEELMKAKGITPVKEIADAHAYVREGLDTAVPGIVSLTSKEYNGSRFFVEYFLKMIFQLKTPDVMIEKFGILLQNELRYELLSFYDSEEHTLEYYKTISENHIRLHDFIYRLNVSDVMKIELLGIAAGSDMYATSLKRFFEAAANKIDAVYRKNSTLLHENLSKIQQEITGNDGRFFTEDERFAASLQKNNFSEIRVAVSFLYPHIARHRMNQEHFDVFIGMYSCLQEHKNVNIDEYSLFFKALSDDTRIRIIELVKDREMYMGEISKSLGVPLTTLTYHIGLLNDADILNLRNEGKKTFCSFNPAHFNNAAAVLKLFSKT